MNAPTTAAALAPAPTEYREIPIAEILPSLTDIQKQRRADFDKAELASLAEQIKIDGVQQPAVVRPISTEMRAEWQLSKQIKPGAPEQYELVFGERRMLASVMAGLTTLPVRIRVLDDIQVLRLQLAENLQREGLKPLHEAEGYRTMRDRLKMSVPDIAKDVAKSREYVYARLKLCDLKGKARKALQDGEIHTIVAVAIARLPSEAMQADCLEQLLEEISGSYDDVSTDDQLEFIRENFMLDLNKAPFNVKTVYFDTSKKVAKGTSTELPLCEGCPKRAANIPDMAAELKKGQNLCTDKTCYDAKRDSQATEARLQAEKDGIKVIAGDAAKKAIPYHNGHIEGFVSEEKAKSYYNGSKTINLQKGLGEDMPEPVLIQSPHDGAMIKAFPESALVAAAKKAGLVKPSTQAGRDNSDYAQQQREADRKARLETSIRLKVLGEIVKNIPLDRTTLIHVAVDYYERLWHENQKRVCKLYDMEHCGTGEIEAWCDIRSGADIGRFMMAMALIGHCHINSYNSGEHGKKILRETAARAGVDYGAIEAEMKGEAREKAKAKAKKAAKPAAPAAGEKPKAKAAGAAKKAKTNAAGAAKEQKDEAGAEAPAESGAKTGKKKHPVDERSFWPLAELEKLVPKDCATGGLGRFIDWLELRAELGGAKGFTVLRLASDGQIYTWGEHTIAKAGNTTTEYSSMPDPENAYSTLDGALQAAATAIAASRRSYDPADKIGKLLDAGLLAKEADKLLPKIFIAGEVTRGERAESQ